MDCVPFLIFRPVYPKKTGLPVVILFSMTAMQVRKIPIATILNILLQ